MSFISDLGYFIGGVHSEEVDRKQLKCFIDIQLLMEVRFWEERKCILGNFWKLLVSLCLILLLMTYPLWPWLGENFMKGDVLIWIIGWGIWPLGIEVSPYTTLNPSRSFGVLISLMKSQSASVSGFCSFRECSGFPSGENYLYLYNLSGRDMEEELETMARYILCASATLVLVGGSLGCSLVWLTIRGKEPVRGRSLKSDASAK